MEQVNNSSVLAMLQTITSQNQPPKTGKSDTDSDFQKLMDKAASSTSKDTKAENQPKTEKTAVKKSDGQQEEEDPIEASKRLQVYLAPVSPEVLKQYPASWLPQNLEEGEPIVCVGVRAGENGEDVPILVGANTANKMFGRQIVATPEQMIDVSDPEADAMLEATAPGADNSPAAMLEKVTAEMFGKEAPEMVEEVQPQEDNGDMEMELLDAEQAPQQIFHDVEAVPMKVGDVENTEQVDEPDVVQQLDTQIAQALQRGDSTVTVRLNPENLGEVTIQITTKSSGVLAVAITARNDDTKALLERHAANLQEVLGSRVRENVEVNVQSQQSQNQQQNYDGHNGHAQDGQQRRQQRQEPTNSQDFIQQLRLGLIPVDGDEE